MSGTLSRIPVKANGTRERADPDRQRVVPAVHEPLDRSPRVPDPTATLVSGGEDQLRQPRLGPVRRRPRRFADPEDPCGDPPGGLGVANTSPTSAVDRSARRSAAPDEDRVLNGAARISPDSAAGVPGNPLYNSSSPSSNACRILAYGLRNPFRFTRVRQRRDVDRRPRPWRLGGDRPRPHPGTGARHRTSVGRATENQTHLAGFAISTCAPRCTTARSIPRPVRTTPMSTTCLSAQRHLWLQRRLRDLGPRVLLG